MTTLRDLLRDLIHEVQNNEHEADPEEIKDEEDMLDEYIETIKAKIIG